MKVVTYFLSILFTLILTGTAFAQKFEWAKRMGGPSEDGSMDMAVDQHGNTYIVGYFRGTNVDFDPGPGTAYLNSAGGADIFVAKYDSSGHYLWANGIGGSNDDIGARLKINSLGNVYIAGWFASTNVDFDPGIGTAILSSAGATDIYFAKYDANGNYLWAKSIGSSLGDGGHDIALDDQNNVYITGYFYGTNTDFDPGPGTAYLSSVANSGDIFFAKYDSLGNYLWAKSAGGSNYEVGNAISLDDSNNVYLTGAFKGTNVDFDPGPGTAYLNSAGGYDIFFAKYDSSGNFSWVRQIGGTGDDIGGYIASVDRNNVYVLGHFQGANIDFDPGSGTTYLSSAGGFDFFFADYDAYGNYLWAKKIGGTGDDYVNDFGLDGLRNFYITGSFWGTSVDFDPGPGWVYLNSAGNTDIFFARYDTSGNYIWAANMGGSYSDGGSGIGVDSENHVYVTGYFAGTNVDFDPDPPTSYLSSAGSADVFLAKYSQTLKGLYLGQTPPDTIPKRFPPRFLLSNGNWWWHGSPTFSPDNSEMYFVKYVSDKPSANMEMYGMKMDENQEWTFPQSPSFASDSGDNSPAFAKGGNRLLFTSYRDGSMKIYQVFRADTGWSVPQLVNMDYSSLPGGLGWDISLTPDQTIYFEIYSPGNGIDIYRSRLEDGMYSQFERLPDEINSSSNEATPYVDPDERYIIFMSNRAGGFGYHDLYVAFKNLDSTWTPAVNMGNRINGPNEDAFPSITPDGEYLFFNSAKTGDTGYNSYWVKASVIEKLNPFPLDTTQRIGFESWRDGDAEIYSMDNGGTSVRQLTTNNAEDRWPGFSRDGAKIAFCSNREGNYEVYSMNGDGSNQQRLTQTPDQDEVTPDLSPDRRKIAYVVSPPGNWLVSEIHVMNSNGSGDTAITGDANGDSRPIWSPDGTKILFYSKRDGHYEIYRMNPDGSSPERLTNSSTDKAFAQWSPDGNKIAYNTVDLLAMTGQVHVMNADGSSDTTLTDASGFNENPCWSADGSKIAFQSNRGGNYEVYLMNADGSGQHNLTLNSSWDSWPSWGRRCSLGDADSSGNIDVGDVVYLINYLFKNGPAPKPVTAGDSNNDNEVTVADIIYLINYLFKSGMRPSC